MLCLLVIRVLTCRPVNVAYRNSHVLKACGAVFVKFSLGGSEFRLAMTSGAGSISKVGAKIPAHSAGNFFLLCLPPPRLFRGASHDRAKCRAQ